MKQLLDFLPLLVFFVFYKFQDIYWATGALLITSTLQISYMWLRHRKVEKTMLFTFLLVLVFGGLTMYLQSEMFIKWKVSIVNWLFCAGLIISQLLHKNPIKQLLGQDIELPDVVWNRLNTGWALFFLLCGLINVYVAFWLPTDVWVSFKVFGLTGMTLGASILTGVYLYRAVPAEDQAATGTAAESGED